MMTVFAFLRRREPPLSSVPLPHRLIAEALGVCLIVFFGPGSAVISEYRGGAISHEGISACNGLVVMGLIYALGHVSGAHFNPGVTISFALVRHFSVRDILPYIVAQFVGGIAGAALLLALFGDVANLGTTLPSGSEAQSFGTEVVLTFMLMFVIMAVATDARAAGQTAAIAIGATVGLDVLLGGPISSASMNPARSLGPAVVSGELTSLWLYLVAPPLGALLGAAVYQFIRGDHFLGGETHEHQADSSPVSLHR
ncbi:MAG TPA: aquaporin [Dehalococcoidia bacterium]|nr:aquaporin [Dehalococcoidia bacterium]